MRRAFELGIILLAVAVGTTPATALVLSRSQVECQEAIAKQGLRFLAGVVDLEQRCHDADLRADRCLSGVQDRLASRRLVDRLHTSSKSTAPAARRCWRVWASPAAAPIRTRRTGSPSPISPPASKRAPREHWRRRQAGAMTGNRVRSSPIARLRPGHGLPRPHLDRIRPAGRGAARQSAARLSNDVGGGVEQVHGSGAEGGAPLPAWTCSTAGSIR